MDTRSHSEKFNCRMYENKFPEVDDLVMVVVTSICDMGCYVSLLEYNSIEGMILQSELSRQRIKSINRIVRVGRQEAVVVLRVDKEKGYIDLSKRRVSVQDVAKLEAKYNKSRMVHSIMRYLAETLDKSCEELYQMCTWPLFTKFGHAYDAFKLAISNDKRVFGELNIPQDVLDNLMKLIRRRLTPTPMKIRADIDITCFTYEGVDAIRAALLKGEQLSTEQNPIQIKLVAPPMFVMFTSSLDKATGIETLNRAIEVIQAEITERKGILEVKNAPHSITEREETEFSTLLKQLEKEGQNEGKTSDESESDSD